MPEIDAGWLVQSPCAGYDIGDQLVLELVRTVPAETRTRARIQAIRAISRFLPDPHCNPRNEPVLAIAAG